MISISKKKKAIKPTSITPKTLGVKVIESAIIEAIMEPITPIKKSVLVNRKQRRILIFPVYCIKPNRAEYKMSNIVANIKLIIIAVVIFGIGSKANSTATITANMILKSNASVSHILTLVIITLLN